MTGIILAGGQSRRMGKDKAELPWKDGTMLTATIDTLLLLCSEVVVVGPQRTLAREVRWVQDHYVGKGPLAGLHAGLKATTTSGALVLPCDMPAMPIQVLEELIRLSKDVDMVIPIRSGGKEPLCAWYSKSVCLPVIEDLLETGYSSLLDILPRVRVREFEVEKLFPQVVVETSFANLNWPIDYEAAKQEATETFLVSREHHK